MREGDASGWPAATARGSYRFARPATSTVPCVLNSTAGRRPARRTSRPLRTDELICSCSPSIHACSAACLVCANPRNAGCAPYLPRNFMNITDSGSDVNEFVISGIHFDSAQRDGSRKTGRLRRSKVSVNWTHTRGVRAGSSTTVTVATPTTTPPWLGSNASFANGACWESKGHPPARSRDRDATGALDREAFVCLSPSPPPGPQGCAG
jgi:hypothetical protein